MGNEDEGGVVTQLVDVVLYDSLGLGIEGAGAFVEDQDSGVLVQLPGYRDPLALSARDLHAVVAEKSVVTVWEVPNELGGVGCFGGGPDLLQGVPVLIPEAHVVADRVVEYDALLCDVPDTRSQPALVDAAVRDASLSKSHQTSDGVSR